MANRYDEITVSGYTPQTMQELAFVPMMKRQQEDKLVADNELIRAGLLKVDPLKEHYAEAIQLKKDIESQIDATSSELAKHGVNRDMIGKTIALNRKYQDLVSPTGRIGQINAAKAIEAQTKKEFMDSPELRDYGVDAKQRAWEKHRAAYTGYDSDKKNIENISSLSAPKYQDMQKDFSELAAKLGEKTVTDLKNSGARFEQGPFGGLIMVTGEGKVITTDNDSNLKSLADFMSAKYVDPKGEGYKSREFAGYDIKNTIDQLNAMLGVPKVYKEVADMNNNYNFIEAPKTEETEGPAGQIISNDTEIKSDATNYEEYSDVLSEIKRLSSSKSLNRADQSKLNDLIELRRNADDRLKSNEGYKKIDKDYKNISSQLEKEGIKLKLSRRKGENDVDYFTRINLAAGPNSIADKLKGKFSNINVQRQKLKNDAWQKSSSLRHNYSYMPSTPKEEGEWNLHNENVAGVLRGVKNISSVLDLTGIQTTGGFRKDVDDDDVANIQDLLKNSDQKSFKISNIQTYGDNRSPEITAVFTTNEDASEYDTQGRKYNDEYGGSKKQVTVTFKLKRLTNAADTGSAPGYKNLTGAIANFYKNKGTVNGITGNFQGQEVYSSLVNNAYADLTNKQLAARYNTDSDAQQALNYRAIKRGVKPSQLLTKYPNNKN